MDGESREASSMAVLQHERFVFWVLLRYLPFVAGGVIVLLFGASVLHDADDIAHTSWSAGGEMLGTFADFGRALLIPVFAASAFFRRGARRILRITKIDAKRLEAEDESGKRVVIPRRAVRSAFRYASSDGNHTVVLELSEGLLLAGVPGDRLSLTVDRPRADQIMNLYRSDTTDVQLATRSPRAGGLIAAASIILGTIIGALLYRWIHHAAVALPRVSYYVRVVPDAATGWLSGLTITAMGLVHAVLSFVSRTPPIVVHRDGVEVRGARHVKVPFSAIASVEVTPHTLRLELDDEDAITISTLTADDAKVAGFAELIRERVAELREDREVPSGLERGEATVEEWRRSLAARAVAPRYRVGALDPDALSSCLRSAAVPRDVRVGAALALSADPDRRSRLREAVPDIAPPTLRALVEELAEGEADEESIVRALHRKKAI